MQDASSLEKILETIRMVKSFNTFEETKAKLEESEVRQAVKALLFALPNTSKYALGHLQDKLAKNTKLQPRSIGQRSHKNDWIS